MDGAQPVDDYVDAHKFDDVRADEHDILEDRGPLFGLALSGGGIRSASFALGVLQALHSAGHFGKFDYLSTVSGGGYIGGALTYFRNRLGPSKDWFPFGYDGQLGATKIKAMGARAGAPDKDDGNQLAHQIVSFLRQHASYMTPSRMFGRPALVAGVLRGVVSTLGPYFATLMGLFGLLIWIGFFDSEADWNRLIPLVASAQAPEPACAPQACMATQSCLAALCAGQEACTAPACAAECLKSPCSPPVEAPPAFYLAIWPGNGALWIAGVAAVVFLLSSLLAGLFQTLDGRDLGSSAGYRFLIRFHVVSGFFLTLAAALLALSTLPWVHAYLNALSTKGGELPATFAALFSAVSGGAALIARLRGVMGGEKIKPSPLRAAGMALAGVAFIYGVLLLAFAAAVSLLEPKSIFAAGAVLQSWNEVDSWYLLALWVREFGLADLTPSLCTFGGGLIAAFLICLNLATPHRLYRDRLMEVFCAERTALEKGEWMAATTAQSEKGWLTAMKERPRPYHLINTCLVTTDSNKRRYRGRGGDNFILSPLFSGSDATGWVKTERGMKTLSLPTAIAISGAALNAHSGPHGTGLLRNKAYSAVLSLLGLNLGFWARNPAKYAKGAKPWFHMPNLLKPGIAALTGRRLDEVGGYVQLSDGGHFENLAIYELIRRRVDFMLISDAGQDTQFSFEDLSNAIERVRVDFGVNLRFQYDAFDLSHLIPGSATSDNEAGKNFARKYQLATRGYAIGTIEYPKGDLGLVVYVKSTLTRHLPGDLYGYKARNNDYPHQTTLDQFFDEDQFEAYRELGYRLTTQLFRDIAAAGPPGQAQQRTALHDVADFLAVKARTMESPSAETSEKT
jgi:hypothetical protein